MEMLFQITYRTPYSTAFDTIFRPKCEGGLNIKKTEDASVIFGLIKVKI